LRWRVQRGEAKSRASTAFFVVRISPPSSAFTTDRSKSASRVVSDCADFAWLCDVFLDETIRGRNLGKWLMQTILAHPDLQGLRRWILATKDAHGLYEQFGFVPLTNPMLWMERPVN
jgi:GNAT superfamily N-acetyltransferase